MTDGARSPRTARASIDAESAALALDAARMGEFDWDLEADVIEVSDRMAAITGLPPGALPAEGGRALLNCAHSDDVRALRAAVREALDCGGRYDAEVRWVRPDDGRTLWIYTAGMTGRGAGRRVAGVVQDISGRKAEDDRNRALVAELDHRVKNVLASVQSLAAQSARKTTSLEAFLKTFAGRLEAMASAHALLTATRWRGAEIGNVIAAELGGLAPGQARWSGPEIVLNPRATNALTLALHELATNAVKFGALSADTGRVEVSWTRRAGGGFDLAWAEQGGPTVAPPTRRGFGATLLERVTGRELGGEARIDFRPQGVRVAIGADATALARTPLEAPVALAETPRHPEQTHGASGGTVSADGVKGRRILIVEDAVLLALELEAGLTEAGAVVVGTAATVEEALRLVDRAFDVAVLDANLNGAAVTPVAEALRARGKPFIFATGYGDAAPTPEGFDAPVVRKPYNIAQIAAAVAQALHLSA